MSRIGKKPILIPEQVTLTLKGDTVNVKGPKGQLTRVLDGRVKVELKDSTATISVTGNDKAARSLWGASRMHVANMIEGVTNGFSKQLQIEGIGYRASVEGKALVLLVGFTHPVKVQGDQVTFLVEKNIITVSGIDKEIVSKVAAQIKRVRPPEPYKGKGIRYVGEIVRKKVGKKAAAGATK
jgi:large subunit ribosomal protein L6